MGAVIACFAPLSSSSHLIKVANFVHLNSVNILNPCVNAVPKQMHVCAINNYNERKQRKTLCGCLWTMVQSLRIPTRRAAPINSRAQPFQSLSKGCLREHRVLFSPRLQLFLQPFNRVPAPSSQQVAAGLRLLVVESEGEDVVAAFMYVL